MAVEYEYRLLNLERPGDRVHEVERIVNEMADIGWEVSGYSAHGWRGIRVPSYSHLILFRRPASKALQHVRNGMRLAEFDKAIDLEADFGDAYAARGFVYADLGEVKRAAADLKKALALIQDPEMIARVERVLQES